MRSTTYLLVLAVIALVACSDGAGSRAQAPVTPQLTAPAEHVTSPGSAATAEAGPETGGMTPDGTARSYAGSVPAPEFPPGLDWLNVNGPLSLADLRGKIVLLDFWTYGCINCLHVIPDLKQLEEKYAAELVVVGVHSAKFDNEAETENIRRIIQRYELAHPVVNDHDFVVWNAYGARAWPTFVLIDPQGNIVGYEAGEGIYDLFDFVIGEMVREFEAELDRTPLALALERERLANKPLLFPGKVLADAAGQRLFIADSNHNRLVITDFDGRVLEVAGSGIAGLQDGDFLTARFFRPQGLALAGAGTLYVADTGNHAIRRVDLALGTVTTVAGTGEQVYSRTTEGRAQFMPLNSPWDVLYHDGLVYIAMAGQHQIWLYEPATETVRVFAGSGREELRDGPLLQAGLNQPSGLASDGERLYIADSEASAIRVAAFAGDRLDTLAGTGLFDFGDVDGRGDAVRLQHPLGVAYEDGLLYLADTYNSKIKTLDPDTREVRTYLGGEIGWRDGADPRFDEPGGLSVAAGMLFVADTNNHAVRRIDLSNGETETLVLIDERGLLTRAPAGDYGGRVVTLPAQAVGSGPGTLRLDVEAPRGYKLNDLAPFSMLWQSEGEVVVMEPEVAEQALIAPEFPLSVPATFAEGETMLRGDLVIYFCAEDAQALCLIEQVRLLVPVSVRPTGATGVDVSYAVPDPPE
jgi:thiol-disulfide isomerase/thioredoxin/sugar lactone lactonase YvrE